MVVFSSIDYQINGVIVFRYVLIVFAVLTLCCCRPSEEDKRQAEKHYFESKKHVSAAQYDLAYESISKAILLNSKEQKYHYVIGNILLQKGDIEEAKKQFVIAVKIDESVPIPYIGLATLYVNIGDFDMAKIYIDKALALDPKEPYVNQFVGCYYFERKEYKLALEFFEKVFAAGADFLHVKGLLGQTLVELERYEEAIPYLSAYLEEEKTDRRAIARAYLAFAKADMAYGGDEYIAALVAGLEMDPGLSASIYAATIQATGKDQGVELAMLMGKLCDLDLLGGCQRREELLNGVSVEELYGKGIEGLEGGDPLEAISFFRLAVKKNPSFGNSYIGLANSYRKLGEIDKAILNSKIAINYMPEDYKSHFVLALCYSELNDHKMAIPAYVKSINLNPNNHEANYRLGQSYLYSGRMPLAVVSQIVLRDKNSRLATNLFGDIVDFSLENNNFGELFSASGDYRLHGENRLADRVFMEASNAFEKQRKTSVVASNGDVFTSKMYASSLYENGLYLYEEYTQTDNESIGEKSYWAIMKSCRMGHADACEITGAFSH